MSQNDNASPREIEARLEKDRIRIDHTLDLLEDRCRPSVLFDQACHYARAKSQDGTPSRLQNTVVNNPLPVVLMGAGLAWLLVSGSRGSVARADSPLAEGTPGQSPSTEHEQPADTTRHDPSAAAPGRSAASPSSRADERSNTQKSESGRPDQNNRRQPSTTQTGAPSSASNRASAATDQSTNTRRSGS